ncbi:MAG: hypothetical protein M1608_14845, partial [Candidatus Omnitrophica bacterium]|nr:hypothetical protein [Candidatus Omnitrophota bacterium]
MIAIRSSCIRWLERSPILPRAVPLLVFVGLTYFQGKFGEASRYWFYLAKTLVGAWFILMVRPLVPEMRWRLSWEAVAMGILVFVMWIGLDDCAGWLGLKSSWINWNQAAGGWNPHDEFGLDSGLAWGFIGMRILGSTW